MSAEALLQWNNSDTSLNIKVKAIQQLFTYRNCIRLRLLLGYSRKQWAAVIGISYARVVELENNMKRVKPFEALAYAALAPANFAQMWDDNVEIAARMFPCAENAKAVSKFNARDSA